MNRRRIVRVARFALLLGAVVLVATYFRGRETYTIPKTDQSMYPTYPGGSRVVVETLDDAAAPERGTDVVYVMESDGKRFARFGRIQALPGDVVGATDDGRLTVNGTPVGPIAIPGRALGTVPPGHYLILAINPAESRYPDSRRLGFIPRADIQAIIRYAFAAS